MLTLRQASIVVLGLALTGCVSAPRPSEYRAPLPVRTVDPEQLYTGRWLEIARPQLRLTDGCVAGATNYTIVSATRVNVRDTCQAGTPQGPEKSLSARADILDPGVNARLRVRYLSGFVTWDYWILDFASDYSWFISADPTFDKLWIFTREVPEERERQALVARAEALGYDVSRLEFPAF